MAKFKCKHSGCIYEWVDDETIKNMRAHPEYVEVTPTDPRSSVPPKPPTKKEKL